MKAKYEFMYVYICPSERTQVLRKVWCEAFTSTLKFSQSIALK